MATQYTEEFKNDAVRYWKEEEGEIFRVMVQRSLHACVKNCVIHRML